MLVRIQMLQTIGIEARGPTDDSVHLVAFFEKQFGTITRGQCTMLTFRRSNSQIRAILAGDTCVIYNQ